MAEVMSELWLTDFERGGLDRLIGKVEAGEALRREKKAADPFYEPAQAGGIDSTIYLLNLHACCYPYARRLQRIDAALKAGAVTTPEAPSGPEAP